jgi:hypothetical protein
MQSLIATLLLICAFLYLTSRWMPQSVKRPLYAWLSRKLPFTATYLNSSESAGCGGGCSSCSSASCDSEGNDGNKTSHGISTVTLVRRQ